MMAVKRPAFTAAVCMLLSMLAAVGAGFTGIVIIAALLLLGGAALFFMPRFSLKSAIMLALCVCAISILVLGWRQRNVLDPPQQYYDQKADISARLLDDPVRRGDSLHYRCSLLESSVGGEPDGMSFYLVSRDLLEVEPYDTVRCEVYFYRPSGSGVDRFASENTALLASVNHYGIEPEVTPAASRPVMYQIIKLRRYIKSFLSENLPGDAGAILTATVIGDRSGISEETYSNFNIAGLAHIICVSGVHLTIIAGLFMRLFKSIGIRHRISAALCLPVVLFICAVCGFSPSIVRAGIMYAVYLLSQILLKEPDTLNSLSISVIIMLLVNPLYVVSLSFLMSVFSLFGMMAFSKSIDLAIKRRVPFLCRVPWLVNIVSATLAANIAITPLVLLYFNQYSLVFVLGNLLVMPIVSAMLLSGLLAVFISAVPVLGAAAQAPLWLAGMLAKYMKSAAALAAKIPFARAYTGELYVMMCLAAVLFIVGIYLVFNRAKRAKLLSVLCVLVLLSGIGSHVAFEYDVVTVAVPNIYSGTAVILRKNGSAALLGCGADKYAAAGISSAMAELGISELDLVVIPSYNADVAGGAAEVLGRVKTKAVLMPPPDEKSPYYHAVSAAAGEHTLIGELEMALNGLEFVMSPAGGMYISSSDFTIAIPAVDEPVNNAEFTLSIGVPGAVKNTPGAGMFMFCGRELEATAQWYREAGKQSRCSSQHQIVHMSGGRMTVSRIPSRSILQF